MKRFAPSGVLLAVWCLAVPARAGADAADDAIDQLNQRNIEFTPSEFIDLVFRNDADNLRFFLGAGMNPDTPDEKGTPALILAATKGLTETVRALLEGKARPDLKTSRGWTSLHFACLFGHVETVQALIDGKADVMAENEFGMTPMHLAVQERQVRIVEALLKAGARADHRSASGISPLSIALETGQKDLVKLFAGHGYGSQLAALKSRFASELAQVAKEEKVRETDRKAKLRKALEAAGGSRDTAHKP